MPTQEELTKQRKLLQVRYALEDYHESIRNLSKVGVAHLLLAAVWLISIVAGSTHNWSHIGICCVVGLSLLVLARQPHWSRQLLMMATGGYVLSLLIEALLFGLPDILIPKLNMHEWRGFSCFYQSPYALCLLGATNSGGRVLRVGLE